MPQTRVSKESGPAMMNPSFLARSFHFSTSDMPTRPDPCSMTIKGAGEPGLMVDGTYRKYARVLPFEVINSLVMSSLADAEVKNKSRQAVISRTWGFMR